MIVWKKATIKIRTTEIVKDINLEITKGKALGIIGSNGTGKTMLVKAIAGQIQVQGSEIIEQEGLKKVFVSFLSSFRMRNGFAAFRQQRWNNIDPDSVPTVKEELGYEKNKSSLDPLLEMFNFRQHIDKYVISLSNGEQRKLELIRALSQKPDVLVLDNAYNGLDHASRELLTEMLNKMADTEQTFILTGSKKEDFPPSVKHFILLHKQKNPREITRDEIPAEQQDTPLEIIELPRWKNSQYHHIIEINNVSMKYGEKGILKDISWKVSPGEHWVLSGGNGSGKTSLLNLIFADNPKAYACNIKLFGKQRGSGESIWNIKQKIGFISPELQQYLPDKQSALQVICSGLYDSEGLFTKPTSYELSLAKQWLMLVGDTDWAEKPYGELSTSAQRVVLLIRTLIKNPPLLLLDEPFQGLDRTTIMRMKTLLQVVAQKTNCAMVLTTHFPEEIPDFFDHELALDDGNAIFCGPMKQSVQ
jgi:molybdate transport system ATP-binding protein